jgi:hypothetical protein
MPILLLVLKKPVLQASVCNSKGFEKSGYFNVGGAINLSFRI